ncbi:hypothetical protein GBS0709_05590 [Edwardsiella tarda]|nr:hypothetical protein GBS0709_05590 [Edwardsiella tarda]GAC65451.1 hypothetical protein ET1_17_00150 [Edwardsiella tarda ATCC 15947 = NBRC 105688]
MSQLRRSGLAVRHPFFVNNFDDGGKQSRSVCFPIRGSEQVKLIILLIIIDVLFCRSGNGVLLPIYLSL